MRTRIPNRFNDDHSYSSAALAGNFIFLSHQGGGRQDSDDITVQLTACLENLQVVLQEAGAALGDIVQLNLMLKDIADFAKAREVLAVYFRNDPPARSAVTTQFVSPKCLCQVDAIAYKNSSGSY